MAYLTKKQQAALRAAENRINQKRTQWLAAYDQAKADGSTVLLEGSTLKTLWDELEELRTKRNNLLDQYRSEGRYI